MEESSTFHELQQLLPALAHLINNNDGKILADACQVLLSNTFESEERAQEVSGLDNNDVHVIFTIRQPATSTHNPWSSKETRKVEKLLRRENHELNEEMGALKRKVEELDGRVAELEEREHGKDADVKEKLTSKCYLKLS
jgi:predicted RNase H-like nuclease (RuvC/YqgF family)